LASKLISGKSFFREQLGSEAIPGFDQSQQKVAIPNVSMTKLVSFSFCQDQRLAGLPYSNPDRAAQGFVRAEGSGR